MLPKLKLFLGNIMLLLALQVVLLVHHGTAQTDPFSITCTDTLMMISVSDPGYASTLGNFMLSDPDQRECPDLVENTLTTKIIPIGSCGMVSSEQSKYVVHEIDVILLSTVGEVSTSASTLDANYTCICEYSSKIEIQTVQYAAVRSDHTMEYPFGSRYESLKATLRKTGTLEVLKQHDIVAGGTDLTMDIELVKNFATDSVFISPSRCYAKDPMIPDDDPNSYVVPLISAGCAENIPESNMRILDVGPERIMFAFNSFIFVERTYLQISCIVDICDEPCAKCATSGRKKRSERQKSTEVISPAVIIYQPMDPRPVFSGSGNSRNQIPTSQADSGISTPTLVAVCVVGIIALLLLMFLSFFAYCYVKNRKKRVEEYGEFGPSYSSRYSSGYSRSMSGGSTVPSTTLSRVTNTASLMTSSTSSPGRSRNSECLSVCSAPSQVSSTSTRRPNIFRRVLQPVDET